MYVYKVHNTDMYYPYVSYLSKSLPCFTQYLTASQLISQPHHLILTATTITHLFRTDTFHQFTCSIVQPQLPAHPPSPWQEATTKVPSLGSVASWARLWASKAACRQLPPREHGDVGAKMSH